MKKAEKSWNGMRKYLEQEMVSDLWKGRIRYNCSTSVGMDGCRFFEVYIDGKCIKRFSWETVNSYFIDHHYVEKQHPMTTGDYWKDFWALMDQYPMNTRTEYTDGEFCNALEFYRNNPFRESIHSENPIVRMFALFDRRLGKRKLNSLKEEMQDQPEWLQGIYQRMTGGSN